MKNIINLKSEKYGKSFNARFVVTGDKGGPNMLFEHNGDPVVEIYDAEHDFSRDPEGNKLGQLVSTYYAETLLTGRASQHRELGLDLDSGVENWTLDGPAFKNLHDAVVDWVLTYEEEQTPSAPKI